jgi:hypothetical protein
MITGRIKSQQAGGLNAPGDLQTHGSDAFYKVSTGMFLSLQELFKKQFSRHRPGADLGAEWFRHARNKIPKTGSHKTIPSGFNRGSGAV